MVINERPWNPFPKVTIPWRRVYERAIFTAFSTASAPVEKNEVFAGPSIGAR